MHSIWKRIEFLFSTASSLAMILLLAVALSNFWLSSSSSSSFNKIPPPNVELTLKNVLFSRGPTDYYIAQIIDSPELVMSLKADFSRLFHWNCKQLFLYIKMEYSTSKYNVNEIIVWDRIITRADSPVIDLPDFVSKYRLADISGDFYGKRAKLRLYWNVVPWVGFMGNEVACGQSGAEVETVFSRLKDFAPHMPDLEFKEPVKIDVGGGASEKVKKEEHPAGEEEKIKQEL